MSGVLEFVVARFNIDGSLANTEDSFGKVTTSFSAGDDIGSGIAVQSDDKIVVVGTSDVGSGTSEFAVARYLLDLTGDGDGSDDGGGDGGSGGGGSCFIETATYGSPTIGSAATMALMLLFCSGFMKFGWFRRKYKK